MLKLTKPLLVFDLETTGVDTQKDRIVEFAAIKLAVKGKRTTLVLRINPEMPIPEGASEVHGILDEDVEDCPTFLQCASKIRKFMSNCNLSGYNVQSFDIPLLAAEFRRVGQDWPPAKTVVVDPFMVFKLQERRNLAGALRFYCDEEQVDAHEAKADTEAALKVLLAQVERYGVKSVEELADLGRDPDWVDGSGKFIWIDGEVTFAFGKKWAGQTLEMVAVKGAGYLRWMIREDFSAEVKQLCSDALAGKFPKEN